MSVNGTDSTSRQQPESSAPSCSLTPLPKVRPGGFLVVVSFLVVCTFLSWEPTIALETREVRSNGTNYQLAANVTISNAVRPLSHLVEKELVDLDIPECRGKERVAAVLLQANVSVNSSACKRLPSWQNISELYGEDPVVIGLETCQAYRELLSPSQNNGTAVKPMPRVAGLYNSGTNALAQLFETNFGKLKNCSFFLRMRLRYVGDDFVRLVLHVDLTATPYSGESIFRPRNTDGTTLFQPAIQIQRNIAYRW